MEQKQWWHDKIAYQIYPKSFMDSNGDGIGDLQGIISKLDYIQALGIDIVWISPIYKSPFVDQGYDISDYYAIDPSFGTMEDFDVLLVEAKKRNIHIVMDLVANHCSDQHEWFKKAVEDTTGQYGDYFYFEKGRNGQPPSQHRAYFGGNAWELVPGQKDLYYLHLFAKEQPDINWNNPKMKKELFDMINWWLDKGVSGFRIDAIINIKKNLKAADTPPDGNDGLRSAVRMIMESEGVGELLQEMKRETFDKYNAFSVAEVFNMKDDELPEFIGDGGHFSSMFDFSAHSLTEGEKGWYSAKPLTFKKWRSVIFESQKKCYNIGFLSNILENHDEPRGICRYLPTHALNDDGIKMLGTVNILLRGLPFLYQGQEIGMRNWYPDSVDQYNDISTLDQYKTALAAGLTADEALNVCHQHSRDSARTPMQWTDGVNAGFTTGNPWLPVNCNYKDINIAAQEKDSRSVLAYYRQLIALRKSEKYKDVFVYGETVPMYLDEDNIFAYLRNTETQTVMVVANFNAEAVDLTLKSPCKKILLQNRSDIKAEAIALTLPPSGVVVIEL